MEIKMSEEKQDLSWLLSGLPEMKAESLEDSQKHFKKEIELIDFIAAVLGGLAFFTMANQRNENILLSSTYPSSDWKFHAHLTDLINTFISIKELCLNGFDTQARSLVRVLDERIYQNLILFSSPEDYRVWADGESSKQAHFELFSKKKSIFKKIRALDEKYLDQKNAQEALAIRKEYEEYYSDSIHGASLSIYAGSLAYPFGNLDDGPFVSTLYGRASSCSYQTLHHTIGQMAYFVIMIGAILEDVHSLKHIEASDLIDTYRNNRYEIMEKANNLILSDEDQDQPNE
jgi:hypothetical protein